MIKYLTYFDVRIYPYRLNTRYFQSPITRKTHISETEVDRRDYTEIENIEKGGPIAIADYHILNNGDVSILRQNLLELMDKILTDDNSR